VARLLGLAWGSSVPDRDHLDALKQAAQGARVAAALGLRGRGRRYFCPVCQADGVPHRTPDLSVGDRGFACFKCGAKGDLVKLVELAAGLDFAGAVAWLERETGIRPPGGPVSYRPKQGRTANKESVEYPSRRPTTADLPAENRQKQGNGPAAAPDPAVYDAFLAGCRPVEGRVLDWLTTTKGIGPDVVEACHLRFCGREYRDLIADLQARYGDGALLTAGLLKRSKTDRLVPTFWHYYAKKTGFLVIPYLQNGRPVYLKVRPPCTKDQAERRGLTRFLNTAAAVPCLYNVDALQAQADAILICEGESDTWTALSYGFAAVGSPGARSFRPDWVPPFRSFVDAAGRSTVYLVLDADAAGTEGARIVADLFLTAGLPVPRRIVVPAGKDLSDYMLDWRNRQTDAGDRQIGQTAETDGV